MTPTNRVILTGRIAKPPRQSFRPDGACVIQFPFELDDSDEPPARKGLNLIDVVAFGKLAEAESGRLQSGQHLRVEGRLKQRRWQTPEGRNRTCTEVIATDLRSLDNMNRGERGEENEET